jgi:signal peptidase I
MEDALLVGDYVIVCKLGYGDSRNRLRKTPKVGEILVFRSPEHPDICVVKRCVAIAQQIVTIRQDGIYTEPQNTRMFSSGGKTIRVPDGCFCALGDNLRHSDDSRVWGPISQELIIGKALVIYFSITSNWRRIRWNRIGRRL